MNYTNQCRDCGNFVSDYDDYCFECRAKNNNPPVYETPPFAGDLTAKAIILATKYLLLARGEYDRADELKEEATNAGIL